MQAILLKGNLSFTNGDIAGRQRAGMYPVHLRKVGADQAVPPIGKA